MLALTRDQMFPQLMTLDPDKLKWLYGYARLIMNEIFSPCQLERVDNFVDTTGLVSDQAFCASDGLRFDRELSWRDFGDDDE